MEAKTSISLSISKLQDLLHDEATTINPSLQKQVQTAIDNLHASKRLLEDVDVLDHEASSGGSEIHVQLLEAVYSAEDAIDTLLMRKKLQQIRKSIEDDLEGFRYFTHKLKSFCRRIRMKSFTQKMKKFNDEVGHVVKTKEAGTSNVQNNNIHTPLQMQHRGIISDFYLEKETLQVVGLHEQQIEELVAQLIPQHNPNDGGQSRTNEIIEEEDQFLVDNQLENYTKVIAVVGEGGSGKTTLVRTVYNRVDVKRHFAKRAWVRIPGVFKVRDVLLDILEQVNPAELHNMLLVSALSSRDSKQSFTWKLLAGVRFLIVIDDVTPQVWESLELERFFLASSGSKVIIVNRNIEGYIPKDVFLRPSNPIIETGRLNGEDSWRLFSKKIRIVEDELNNSKLITLKEQITNLCGGLPSIIVLLAGLLSTKERSYDEWSRVLIMLANKSSEDVMALSYQDLPQEVKPCFLYMGLFPRGFDIPVRRLVHLWCAEGFTIPSAPTEIDPEYLAEMCLEELITRKMVQVRWSLDGSPKTCRMPSILYDFFSPKAANVGFLYHHFQSSQTSQKEPKFAVRRLAAYTGNKDLPPFEHLRSYVALNDWHDVDRPGMIIFNEGFGVLLKLLDLEGVYKPKLSGNVVKKLLQLRYLGLRSTFIDDLSDSMKYLSNLEALDVKHTNIHSISIPKASKLRHVYLDYQIQNHQDIISRLVSSNLRTLWRLEVSVNCLKKYRDLFFCMRKLRKLGLIFCTKMFEFNTMAEWINQLTELQSLKLRSIDSHHQASIIDLMTMANHHKLQQLYLRGYLPQSAIDVLYLPPNLKKLTLSLSQLEKDPMPVLERLPHLNILRLYPRSYIGVKMTCGSQRFPKLRLLKLWNIPIQDWTVEEGAMPCLRELEISSCKKLELPQWLQNVTSLKEIVLRDMPTLFGAAVEKSLQDRGVEIKFSNLFRLYDSKE